MVAGELEGSTIGAESERRTLTCVLRSTYRQRTSHPSGPGFLSPFLSREQKTEIAIKCNVLI
jgi:hypothetical protein